MNGYFYRARRSTNPCELFLRNVPGQLDHIALAVQAGDCAVVRVRTHKLKSSSARRSSWSAPTFSPSSGSIAGPRADGTTPSFVLDPRPNQSRGEPHEPSYPEHR
jgi:hypothetical protein